MGFVIPQSEYGMKTQDSDSSKNSITRITKIDYLNQPPRSEGILPMEQRGTNLLCTRLIRCSFEPFVSRGFSLGKEISEKVQRSLITPIMKGLRGLQIHLKISRNLWNHFSNLCNQRAKSIFFRALKKNT